MISAVTVLYHKIRQHSLDRSVFTSILLIANMIIEKIGIKLGGGALTTLQTSFKTIDFCPGYENIDFLHWDDAGRMS